ncbi:hypothetical protein, partial [Staphylococcus aureus]|nr:hypothetical protein [Staphylococcus aureus]
NSQRRLTQDIEPPSTEPYARWCERTNNQVMIILLLDWLYNLRDFDLIRDLLVFSFTNSDFNVSAILNDKQKY